MPITHRHGKSIDLVQIMEEEVLDVILIVRLAAKESTIMKIVDENCKNVVTMFVLPVLR